MNKKVRKALEESIEKWLNRARNPAQYIQPSPNDCPLCDLLWDDYCGAYSTHGKCPVFEKTGVRCCGKTPYEKYRMTSPLEVSIHKLSPDEVIKRRFISAMEEVEFLRSLLPEG